LKMLRRNEKGYSESKRGNKEASEGGKKKLGHS